MSQPGDPAPLPARPTVEPVEPPEGLGGTLRRIGPGIIITGSIVGSGELIVTTRLGAEVGFTLLWLVILSCVIKVFLQIEIGRHVISAGRTTLEAFDRVPGLRLGANWVVWCWAVMAFFTIFQLSGILSGVGEVLTLSFDGDMSALWKWTLPVAGVTALLLSTGRYRHIERITTFMVFVFTTLTIAAVFFLQGTADYAVHGSDVAHGLSFKLPEGDAGLLTAFGAFGITGVGASELIYYPYWCLEKGYARFAGPREDTDAWRARALGWIRVMKVDAWVSLVVYTVGTVAFYFLGAAVLNRQGVVPQNEEMAMTLSRMYTGTFGEGTGFWIFLIGAFAVLFSTYFVATASNTRVMADAAQVFRIVRYPRDEDRLRIVRILCIALPAICFFIQWVFGKPVDLIIYGAIAQASMLPIIAVATLYLRYAQTDRRIAIRYWATELFLWLAATTMLAFGLFEVVRRFVGR